MVNKKTLKSPWFWLATILTLYALLGFFYAHKPLGKILTSQLKAQTGLNLTYQDLSLNPFTFVISLTNLNITDNTQQGFIKAKSLSTDFNPSSLIFSTYSFSHLQLVKPEVNLAIAENHEISLPQMIFSANEVQKPDDQAAIDLQIDRIEVDNASVHFIADNINKDFNLKFKHLAFSHKQFNLSNIDSNFNLELITSDDETIDFSGIYNHKKQLLKGDVRLTNGKSSTLSNFFPTELMVTITNGIIDAEGHLDWFLPSLPVLDLGHFEISNLSGQWAESIATESFFIRSEDIHIDLNKQFITTKTLAAEQGKINVFWPLNLNLNTNDDSSEPATKAWQYQIDQINVNQVPVIFNDKSLPAQTSQTIDKLRIKNISNENKADEDQNSEIELLLFGEVNSQISVSGKSNFNESTLNAQITVKDLTFQSFNPWLTAAGIQLSQGTLNTEQSFILQNDQSWQSQGQLTLNDLIIENTDQQLIATVAQLQVDKSHIDSLKHSIHIDEITLDRANGQLLLDPNNELNIKHVGQNTDHNKTTSIESKETDEDSATDWTITIGTFNVKDSSTALTDQSIQPQIKTEISDINGHIKELSSVATQHAAVDLNAKLNQFSAVKIIGTINPLSESAFTNLDIEVKDLDLLSFSGYAAQNVNFPIDGGQVNLQMNYQLNKNTLKGDNKFLFKQFKLGSKQNNPDAMNLPLKLAVTLLTNGKNEMHINLPVSGQLDDPEFSVGGIVFKAFVKLITGIVASPFNLLSKLIPNPSPDMNEINFAAGLSDVAAIERLKLEQIGQIFNQKPELNLEMRVSHNDASDSLALKTAGLLERAPFTQFDANDETVINWLIENQKDPKINAENINANILWQQMIEKETVTIEQLNDLQQQRYNHVKLLLVEQHKVSSDKIFQLSNLPLTGEQQNNKNSQLIISVSN